MTGLASHDPWALQTIVEGQFASYRLVEEILPRRLNVRVFKAVVHSSWSESGPPKRTLVVIKALDLSRWPHAVDPALAMELLRHIQLTNELFDSVIPTLLRTQLRSVVRTRDFGDRPVVLSAGTYVTTRQRFMVQDFIDAPNLEDHLQATWLSSRAVSTGLGLMSDWFKMATSLTEHLLAAHDAGRFHRLISPQTLFVRASGDFDIVAVDVGEALFSALPPPALASTTPSNLTAFIAPELRLGAITASPQADLFSVGAVLFYALTRRTPDFVHIVDREALKTQVQSALSGTLADRNVGIADIISRCLRVLPDNRVPSAHVLLQDVRVFGRLQTGTTLAVRELSECLSELTRNKETDVFGSLAVGEALKFMQVLKALRDGTIVVSGNHDEIVWRLCSYLSTLSEGDFYYTRTVPDFWRADNAGVRGRYLSMNLEVARYGATIKRLFLLTPEERSSAHVRAVIDAHIEMRRRFSETRGAECVGSIQTHYLEIRDAERRAALAHGRHAGLWRRAHSAIAVTPRYSPGGRITSVMFGRLADSDEGWQKVERDFLDDFERARPIEQWATEPVDDKMLS